MKISQHFDGGRIEVISARDPGDIQLKIRKDSHSDFCQWFYFRLSGVESQACKMRFLNAGQTSYAKGWEDYNICASYDRETWFRIPSSYDGKVLTVEFTPQYNDIYFAYFAPYSFERHLDLLGWAQQSGCCRIERLGETVDGRDFDMLVIGDQDASKKTIWIIARQHPGETMAEWFIEGLLHRLLDEDDPVSRKLLEKVTFYIVPNMNPDGSVRGNLRTNASGANLNREWQEPTMKKSPEVFLVREHMHKTGVDMFLDIHGDEALPYNFVAGCEGIPGYDDRHHQLEEQFKAALLAVSPDFQDEFGYPKDEPGKANLTVACAYVGETFKCLSYTVEMPFKDNANLPDAEFGWSPERCAKFGEATLTAVLDVVDGLR